MSFFFFPEYPCFSFTNVSKKSKMNLFIAMLIFFISIFAFITIKNVYDRICAPKVVTKEERKRIANKKHYEKMSANDPDYVRVRVVSSSRRFHPHTLFFSFHRIKKEGLRRKRIKRRRKNEKSNNCCRRDLQR